MGAPSFALRYPCFALKTGPDLKRCLFVAFLLVWPFVPPYGETHPLEAISPKLCNKRFLKPLASQIFIMTIEIIIKIRKKTFIDSGLRHQNLYLFFRFVCVDKFLRGELKLPWAR